MNSDPKCQATASHFLPPDPDGKNHERASWALSALIAFMQDTGCDLETALPDLLTDLMHWCDRYGVNFSHELAIAQEQYDAETLEEHAS